MSKTKRVVEIVNEVAERNRKFHEEHAKEIREAEPMDVAENPYWNLTTGQTVRNFQKAVELVISHGDGAKDIGSLKAQRVVKDPAAVIAFDKRYKEYILHQLRTKHGFTDVIVEDDEGNKKKPKSLFDEVEDIEKEEAEEEETSKRPVSVYKPVYRNGTVDEETIYHDVLMKLMLGAMDKFDMSGERVGKGAFRNYLKKIVASAVSDALKPELVPVFDEDGNPVYTGEIAKDRKGNQKLDKNGDPVYKQRKERRISFESANIQNAVADRGAYGLAYDLRKPEWTTKVITSFRYQYAEYAYLALTAAKMKSKSDSWILKAMMDIYEREKDEVVIREDLLKRNVIKDERPFYVAKTRFLDEWKELQEKELGKIFKKIRVDFKCTKNKIATSDDKDKTDKATKKAKPMWSRKGYYQWRPMVSYDAAKKHLDGLNKSAIAEFGKERVRYIKNNFARIMLQLVVDADNELADKNAWRFKKIEQELQAEKAEKAREKALAEETSGRSPRK